jgi:hypothetical protein
VTFTVRRKMIGFALGCVVLAAGAAGCTATEDPDAAASPAAMTSPTPAMASVPAATPTDDGCPPDVNLMYEWLKYTPAIVNEIDKSLTGLEEPTCYQGWSVARTVVKNADSVLVLFKRDPSTGKWDAVAVGSDGVCDGAVKVPEAIQTKLGPGC